MILDFENINTSLKPIEKFHLYKRENRSEILQSIDKLYIKPELAYSFKILNILFFQKFFFSNYLLEKLECFNKIQFIIYIKLLNNKLNFNYIINDYKIYNILWNNKLININLNIFTPIQLLSIFELFIIPLKYKIKEKIDDKVENNVLEKKKKKVYKNYDYMPILQLTEKEIKNSFYNQLEVEETIFTSDVMIEEFLSIHINFQNNLYSYINIEEYNNLLINLNTKKNEITFYLDLANKHNLFLNKLNLNNLPYALFNINIKNNNSKKESLVKIKDFEFKKSLSEFDVYIEFSFKTVKDFIEIFLFKFEFIFSISLYKILELFYNGISNQIIFFEFYNLLIKEFNKLKMQMNLYTLKFILEFLEFLSVLCETSVFNFLFFSQSIFNLINNNYFKNLSLFRFNFWTRLKLFIFNNQTLYYNYLFFTNNYLLNKFYGYILKNFNITQINTILHDNDKFLLNLKTVKNSIKGIDFNKNLSTIYFIVKFFKNLTYNFKILKKIQRKKFLLKKKKDIYSLKNYMLFINYYFSNIKYYLSIKNFIKILYIKSFYNFKILKYINILKIKDIIMYKNYKKKLLPKTKLNELLYMFEIFKIEIKNIFNKINNLRLKFLKEVILYNKNNSELIINYNSFNLLNISMGVIPSKKDSVMINILNLYMWNLNIFLKILEKTIELKKEKNLKKKIYIKRKKIRKIDAKKII